MLFKHQITSKRFIPILFLFFVNIYGQDLLKDWSPPTTITSGAGEITPEIAMDDRGNAVAVWNIDNQIQVSTFSGSEKAWATSQILGEGGSTTSCNLVINPSTGNAIVSWAGPNGVYAAYYETSSSWNSTIQPITTSSSENIIMAIDINGNVTIGWTDTSSTIAKATCYKVNTSWTSWAPHKKEIGTTSNSSQYKIEMDYYGDTFFAWIETSTILNATWYATNESSWQGWTPVIISISSTGTAINSIATSIQPEYCGDLRLIIAWTEGLGVGSNVKATQYNRIIPWNSWSPTIKIMPKVDASAYDQNVAIDRQTDSFISWKETDGVSDTLRATRCEESWIDWSPSGTTIQTHIQFYTMAMDSSGNIFLLWDYLGDPAIPILQSIRYDHHFSWNDWDPTGKIKNVITLDCEGALFPKLATDTLGNAAATWLTICTASATQASLYNVSTDAWQPPRTVSKSTETTYVPQIAMNKAGKVILIWNFLPPDESSYQIQSSWTIDLENRDWANDNPTEADYISFQSDAPGNIYGAARRRSSDTEGIALLLRNAKNDPIDIWTTTQLSTAGKDVSEVSLGVDFNGNWLYGFINDSTQTGSGEAWVTNTANPIQLQLVSSSGQNARDIIVGINPSYPYMGGISYVNAEGSEFILSSGETYRGQIYMSYISGYSGDNLCWETPESVSTTTDASLPKIAFDANNNPFVVWQESDGEKERIRAKWAKRVLGGLNWGSLQYLSIETSNAYTPQVVVDSFGSSIFTWQLSDGSQKKIQAVRYIANWNAWTPLTETVDLSGSSLDVSAPSISMDSAGNAIVGWSILDGNGIWRVQAASFNAQAKSWVLPGTTYLSPEWLDSELTSVSLGSQGYGIISYVVNRQKVYINLYFPDTQRFSNYINPEFPCEELAELVTMANYDDQVSVVGVGRPLSRRSRADDDESSIGIASLKLGSTIRPSSPTNIQQIRNVHRFPTQVDLINVISWQAGDNTAVRYEIYADSAKQILLATIPTTSPLVFCHHCRNPYRSDIYYLYAVNSSGLYSSNPVIVSF